MTTNEIKLIDLIRHHPNPDQALTIADEIISKYLEPSQSFEVTSLEYSREHS